jgi:hypothetical protein
MHPASQPSPLVAVPARRKTLERKPACIPLSDPTSKLASSDKSLPESDTRQVPSFRERLLLAAKKKPSPVKNNLFSINKSTRSKSSIAPIFKRKIAVTFQGEDGRQLQRAHSPDIDPDRLIRNLRSKPLQTAIRK